MVLGILVWANKREEEKKGKFHLQCDSAGRIGPACGELHAGTKLPVQYNTGTGEYTTSACRMSLHCYIIVLAVLAWLLYMSCFSLSPSLNLDLIHTDIMPGKTTSTPRITKFTNCRLVRGSSLVEQDLWIDSLSGKILKDQEAFYELHLSPDEIIDLGGRIVAPGMIDVQLNGAHGFDFSVPCDTKEEYDEGLRMVNRGLARTGVTSYLPTVVSSTPEVYWKVSKPQPNPNN